MVAGLKSAAVSTCGGTGGAKRPEPARPGSYSTRTTTTPSGGIVEVAVVAKSPSSSGNRKVAAGRSARIPCALILTPAPRSEDGQDQRRGEHAGHGGRRQPPRRSLEPTQAA